MNRGIKKKKYGVSGAKIERVVVEQMTLLFVTFTNLDLNVGNVTRGSA
jgi:hypothetical protein